MARFIGSDCTKGALEWQFRRYRAGAKLQIAAVKAGQDPKDITVDVNPQGKPDGKGSTVRDNGPKFLHYCFFHITFPSHTTFEHYIDSPLPPDISKYFGSDSTGGGIGFQFRQIKADAKRQRDCVDAGGDPKNLNIGGKGAASSLHLLSSSSLLSKAQTNNVSNDYINGSQLLPLTWLMARPE
jgi:hypothetical protein